MANEEDDSIDFKAVLRWLFEVCDDPGQLHSRIHAARIHYRHSTDFSDGRWASRDPFEGFADRMAIILSQVVAELADRRTRDVFLASEILPFMKIIGANIELARGIPGAAERARRMLRPAEQHPDGGIFELAVALRYAREPGLLVEFIPEQTDRMADLLVKDAYELGLDGIHVECKRLQPSVYEKTEKKRALEILERVDNFIHSQKLSFSIDITFSSELSSIPLDYMISRLETFTSSQFLSSGDFSWKDEHGHGAIRVSDLDAVRRDTDETYLIIGSKLARLLAGGERHEEHFHLVCGGKPYHGDPRFIDEIHYGTVLFWRCSSARSVNARARHVRSKLADIDRQVAHAPIAIAHIGMDVERDNLTADLRRKRNLETVASFRPNSKLIEVDLHYFMPRASEEVSWMIDETVEPCSRTEEPFLEMPRILGGTGDGLVEDQPAWRQQVPR